MRSSTSGCFLGGCGMWLVWLAIVVAIGGFCFDYSLDVYFGKDIPWYADCAAGLVTSPINIPAAVIGWVLVSCDVPTPIFNPGG